MSESREVQEDLSHDACHQPVIQADVVQLVALKQGIQPGLQQSLAPLPMELGRRPCYGTQISFGRCLATFGK
jgi:hypothetical protein